MLPRRRLHGGLPATYLRASKPRFPAPLRGLIRSLSRTGTMATGAAPPSLLSQVVASWLQTLQRLLQNDQRGGFTK